MAAGSRTLAGTIATPCAGAIPSPGWSAAHAARTGTSAHSAGSRSDAAQLAATAGQSPGSQFYAAPADGPTPATASWSGCGPGSTHGAAPRIWRATVPPHRRGRATAVQSSPGRSSSRRSSNATYRSATEPASTRHSTTGEWRSTRWAAHASAAGRSHGHGAGGLRSTG